MRVVIAGATGMVGGGALRECLEDDRIGGVLALGRRATGIAHTKLTEVLTPDPFDLSEHRAQLTGYDACFYCIGISSAGKSESDYRRITCDLTFAIVDAIAAANPDFVVCFVSGLGSDNTGRSRAMWARVKGEAENGLLARHFTTYVLRPGFIQPLKGARSRTTLYRVLYGVLAPLFPVLRRLFPKSVTTTVAIGQAMIRAASEGYPKSILETADINTLGGSA